MVLPITGYAEDPPAVLDLAKSAVDSASGVRRARFMRAARTDSELSREEFEADARKAGGFVRPFDKWEALVEFDKNGNSTIDWFEATGYLDDLRQRVLAAFDSDHDRHLTGEELAKASAWLYVGEVSAGPAAAAISAPALDHSQPQTPPQSLDVEAVADQRRRVLGSAPPPRPDLTQWLHEKKEAFQRQEAERTRQSWVGLYDKNGDGQVSDDELPGDGERQEIHRPQS